MSHYFEFDENIESKMTTMNITINNISLAISTDRGVFSYRELDYGTKVLIESLLDDKDFSNVTDVIDLGSGYGPIGLFIKTKYPNSNLTLVDVNERAIELTNHNFKENNLDANILLSDFYENINKDMTFDLVISNPPIRIGKEKLFNMYLETSNRLEDDGEFWLVVRKKQGALSHVKYLETIFSEVKIIKRSKGYFVISAIK